MVAHVFPGQGSQYVGMAKEFVEAWPSAREMMQMADDTLHVSLSRAMLEGPEEVLRQTDYTQPAIFLHSAIALKHDEDLTPAQALAGHSLGEYTALYAAGVFGLEQTLSLVHLRGALMAEAGRRATGTMAAIIGLDAEKLTALCAEVESEMKSVVRPANFNSPGQIVVSGNPMAVHEVMRRAKEAGVRIAKELSVSGAFHSPLMQYAADGLREALDSAEVSMPRVPVFSNVTAEPVESATDIRRLLVEQLTAPVRWEQSVKNIYDFGVREFVEYGPGKVLQGLIARTVQNVKTTGVEKPKVVAA